MITNLEPIDEAEEGIENSEKKIPESLKISKEQIEWLKARFGGLFDPNDIYGVKTQCDPPSLHSPDGELERNSLFNNAANKRINKIAKESKKAAKEEDVSETNIALLKAS